MKFIIKQDDKHNDLFSKLLLVIEELIRNMSNIFFIFKEPFLLEIYD